MKKVVVDTNILLETPEILQDKTTTFVIPYTVLKELDDLKRKRYELGYAVRVAVRSILREKDHIIFDLDGAEQENSFNDERIIAATKKHEADLYTEDILMTLLAEAQGIQSLNPITQESEKYEGYIELFVEDNMDDLIQSYYSRPATTTKGFNADVLNKYLPRIPAKTEYVLVNYKNTYMFFKYDEENNYYEKLNYKNKKVKINGSGPTLEPFDAYQHIALTSACNLDVPMTIIDGKVGTGKTILALAAALHLTYEHQHLEKIYITRPPLGVDSRYDIGFLPGSKEEKLNPWVGGIVSNLEFLYPRGAKELFNEKFEHFAVNTAQGYSIHNAVLIVDESQLLSIDVMKQIISRVAEGSKLILLGDEAQTYKVVPRAEMGYRKLKNLLPMEYVEYVSLRKIYRSKLAEISVVL